MKRVFCLLAVIFLAVEPLVIRAESATGTTLSPMSSEFNLRPGDEQTGTFTLTNNNEFDLNISIKFAELNLETESLITDISSAESPTNWITLSTDTGTFQIPKNEKKDVSYAIKVPSDSSEGIYSPALMIEMTDHSSAAIENETQEVSASLVGIVVHQIFIQVSAEGVINLGKSEITNFSVENSLNYKNPLRLNVAIANKSISSYSKPLAELQVIDPKGNIIYQEVINEGLDKLMPGTTLSKTVDAEVNLLSTNSFGKYRAELMVYDTLSQAADVKKIEFWVIPYPFIIIISAIVLLIYLIAISIRYRVRSRKNADQTVRRYK